jgi:hypothetical protein
MKLTPEQVRKLGQWAASGLGLSDIQSRLDTEFGLRLTYMEVRFLMDDHDIGIEPPAPKAEAAPAEEADAGEAETVEADEITASVSVDLDKITRPGAVVSGSVVFSDGVKARWYLDSMGRLGLDGVDKTYRPSPDDVQDFQEELQRILREKGY